MRERPELVGKPLGVGNNAMLCTTNYEARQYGCRSAMPGFIAKKLCPDLILVPPNFRLYKAVGTEVRNIFAEYDPNFEAISLDEGYMDITDFLKGHPEHSPATVATEIRSRIFQTQKITASAGVACNRMLAKICSEVNKPNNQFVLPSDEQSIQQFMHTLPVRKIPGIGSVCQELLKSLGVVTCSDVLEHAVIIYQLFSANTSRFLLRSALGIATAIRDETESNLRKSLSYERTFRDLSDPEQLCQMFEKLAVEVHKDWLAKKLPPFRTITVKFKTDDFVVNSRAVTVPTPTGDLQILSNHVQSLVKAHLSIHPSLTYRLAGVRLSGFMFATSPTNIETFFEKKRKAQNEGGVTCPVCGLRCGNMRQLNQHLDQCLGNESSASAAESLAHEKNADYGERLDDGDGDGDGAGDSDCSDGIDLNMLEEEVLMADEEKETFENSCRADATPHQLESPVNSTRTIPHTFTSVSPTNPANVIMEQSDAVSTQECPVCLRMLTLPIPRFEKHVAHCLEVMENQSNSRLEHKPQNEHKHGKRLLNGIDRFLNKVPKHS
eukprot:c5732_g1_i1.p1 GENE.c5732_g1_i1~~c5732_g1_i1.p1  ORF type:complete len:572 (+),score=129.30 c5732_g1_i1:65-1717(+)